MPRIEVNGVGHAYEIIGDGSRNAIITPGGRFTKDTPGVRELAKELAKNDFKVVIWDRINSGESDICFEGESESIVNADNLAGLLRKLDMAPAMVIGMSAGSRVSLLAAARHPDAVTKLAIVWITGDVTGLTGLIKVYCGDHIQAAKVGGMEAVAKHADLAEAIERHPPNRAKLLAMDPEAFCDKLQLWAQTFIPEGGSPVPGLLPKDFAGLKMPVLIFRSGQSDYSHPRRTTDAVHKLIPGSKLVDPPWGDREWIERVADAKNGLFRNLPLLLPQILEFDRETA